MQGEHALQLVHLRGASPNYSCADCLLHQAKTHRTGRSVRHRRNTRQPDDMQRLLGNGFRDVLVPTVGFPITGQPRMRVRGTEPIATRTVHYTDLDVNGHLNSIRSIDMAIHVKVGVV